MEETDEYKQFLEERELYMKSCRVIDETCQNKNF